MHRQRRGPEGSISLSIEDVVTLFKDNLPCSQWRLGRLEQLIHGTDDNAKDRIHSDLATHAYGILVSIERLLKCHYDENRILPIRAILRHKQLVYTRVKMLFTVFKYLFSFQRYSSF